METRANYVLVGIFTLAAILSAMAFVYWRAVGTGGSDQVILNVRIPGSAAGLIRGSAVLFNGVKVGDVKRVYIDISNPSVAIAETEVDRLTPITPSTQAEIGIQGLTGQAYIEMIGGNPQQENILDRAAADGVEAYINAKPSSVTNILKTVEDIASRTNEVLASVESFFNESREPLANTLRNAEKFSDALAKNSDSIDSFLASVGDLSETLSEVSGELQSTLNAAEKVLAAVDSEKVDNILANVDRFTARLDKASEGLEGIMASVDEAVQSVDTVATNLDETVTSLGKTAEETLTSLGKTTEDSITSLSGKAEETLDSANKVIASVEPERVRTAVANFEQVSRDTRVIAQDIAKVSDTLGKRAGDVDKIISDAGEIAKNLREASTRVDGVLAKLDGFLGTNGEGGEDLFAQASTTLKSFQRVADNLNARLGTITDGLARFSGQGLRDVEALVRDSRRSINRIERAISDLERNPQRIITGGEGTVPRSNGRQRR